MDIREAYYVVTGRHAPGPETDTDTCERLSREYTAAQQSAICATADVQAAVGKGYGLAVRELEAAAFGMGLFLRGRANIFAVRADLDAAKQAVARIEASLT